MNDHEREQLIESWRYIMEHSVEREWKVLAADRMRDLISGRSPEQVARMEEARGLR